MTETAAIAKTCPSCGAVFLCGASASSSEAIGHKKTASSSEALGPEREACWCNDLPPLKNIAAGSDCLCRACLTKRLEQEDSGGGGFSGLKEGEDYYREGGTIVFTALYHLRRGYCCGSGCRHCPYREAKPNT